MRPYRFFTIKEVRYITAHYLTHTDQAIAAELALTTQQVKYKRQQLNLIKRTRKPNKPKATHI